MKCKEIKSSYLKSFLTVQNKVNVTNEYGININTWVDKYTKRGFFIDVKYEDTDIILSQGVINLNLKRVLIRYCDVKDCDRVMYKNEIYKIKNIKDLEEKQKYLILTLEGVNNG